MKYALLGMILCASSGAWAMAVPHSAGLDPRMQQVSYSAHNTTQINAKLGYLTSLVFDEGEEVLSTKTGFDAGWEVSFEHNVIYVLARPVVQDQEDGEGNKVKQVFEPIPAQWKTNLLIRTNKRLYSVELNMLPEDTKAAPAFVVAYRYPAEQQAKARAELEKQQKALLEQKNKQAIAQRFEQADAPKNWDYAMRVGKDSRNITPDFAYDNGVFTYLGFSTLKTFPTAFLYRAGKEQTINFSVETKGAYKVMVIHNINPAFVLRYGDAVVGVVNQGFGRVITAPKNTLSPAVERVEVPRERS